MRDKSWLEKYEIPPGSYLYEQTDTDAGVIMGGSYTDPDPIVVASFIDALQMAAEITDPDVLVEIFDHNGDLVYYDYPAKYD